MSKKTEFTGRPSYSVAMSLDTGCIVMVKTTGSVTSVMGSLTREQSLKFCQDLIAWEGKPPIDQAVKEASQRPKLTLVN